ncbi:hypothetical protein ACFX2J_013416 [Malus domestica]
MLETRNLLTRAVDSYVGNEKSANTSSCESSTESEVGEFPKVCALLKADLLEDVNAYAKFVDSVRKVIIHSDSFAKRPAYLMMSSLIVTMHKTLILVAKSMRVDQDVVKCTKEAEVALVAEFCSVTEKIEKLESKLSVLKGSSVSAFTSF